MDRRIIAAVGIFSVAAAGLLCGCDTLNALGIAKPSASLAGVQFGDITTQGATLIFNTDITNPYPVELPLTNMDYAMTTGEAKLFAGSAAAAGSIPAKSTKTIALPVTIAYSDLLNAFKGIRAGSKIPYEATVGLGVNSQTFGAQRVPISKKGELAVPELNAQSLEQILMDRLNKK